MYSLETLWQGPEPETRVLYCDALTSAERTAELLREHFPRVPFEAHLVRQPYKRALVKVSRGVKAYASDASVRTYRFAGSEVAPEHPMPEWLLHLKSQAELCVVKATSEPVTFNYALINHYPNGKSGIGRHADDENDMVHGAPIASYSAGAPRDMTFHEAGKTKGARRLVKHRLASGSVVLMLGATQRHTKHAIPPRAKVTTPRYNVTFRVMKTK